MSFSVFLLLISTGKCKKGFLNFYQHIGTILELDPAVNPKFVMVITVNAHLNYFGSKLLLFLLVITFFELLSSDADKLNKHLPVQIQH